MNWKDHPVVIAAIAAVAGVAFAVQFLFPALNAQLNYDHRVELDELTDKHKSEIDVLIIKNQAISGQLKQQQAENQNLVIAAEAARIEVASLRASVSAQAQKVVELEMGRLFDYANPYPVGFQQIHILDSIEKVNEYYPEAQINKSRPAYWSVDIEHALFDNITYYFDHAAETPESKVIYMIAFAMRDFEFENRQSQARIDVDPSKSPQTTTVSDDFLVTKLNETLGTPLSWKEGEETAYAWTTPYEVTAYISPYLTDRVILALEGVTPGTWHHPAPRYKQETMCIAN